MNEQQEQLLLRGNAKEILLKRNEEYRKDLEFMRIFCKETVGLQFLPEYWNNEELLALVPHDWILEIIDTPEAQNEYLLRKLSK